MIGRQIHKLRVRNKATEQESVVQVDINGSLEDAKAHFEKTPASRGAPLGFEVLGPADDAETK